MKQFIFILIFLLPTSAAFAERASYEAQLGMISAGGFIVFYNSGGPLSYSTLTRKELPNEVIDIGEVQCRSCQHGISLPLFNSQPSSISAAQGDGSFQKALMNLARDHPSIRGIYDVKVDLHKLSILGFYRRVCTVVTARGFQ